MSSLTLSHPTLTLLNETPQHSIAPTFTYTIEWTTTTHKKLQATILAICHAQSIHISSLTAPTTNSAASEQPSNTITYTYAYLHRPIYRGKEHICSARIIRGCQQI